MKSVSFKNLDFKERFDVVNTPTSLEACYAEGISPEELLYASFREFAKPSLPKEIQQLNYEFFESQRQKLLEIAKKKYFKLLKQKKTSKSQKNLKITKIIDDETQKIKEKNMKYMSKLVNYKLDNIKNIIETDDKIIENDNPLKRLKSKEPPLTSRNFFSYVDKEFNLKRDAELIKSEKEQHEKNLTAEKKKNFEVEIRRKKADEKIQEHILKAKMIRIKEDQEKIQKMNEKNEIVQRNLRNVYTSQLEQRNKRIIQSREKISKVVLTKFEYEEYLRAIRDKIIKEENDKIIAHTINKQKFQTKFQQKIKKMNQQKELKSKTSRENIEKIIEEKKDQKFQEIKQEYENYLKRKSKLEEKNDLHKQKNKLKQIEKEWNIQRLQKKEEFERTEKLNSMKFVETRVNNIQSAKDYIRKIKKEFIIRAETQKSRIDRAIYMMEVQKKYNLSNLKEILRNDIQLSDRPDKEVDEKGFNSTT